MKNSSNPYAARRIVRGGERQGHLPYVLNRLRMLGATDEEVKGVRDHWNQFDDDWTPERQHEMVAMNDRRLREMILATRREYPYDDTPEPEELEQGGSEVVMGVEALPQRQRGATVDEVLAWVGSSPDRAAAALEAERAGRNRSTLVARLEAMA